VSADTSELLKYASQVASVVDSQQEALSDTVEGGAKTAVRESRSILRSYSRGRFLKHYPRSIGYDMIDPFEAEYGPDAAMPQGGMSGVELGSVHTPPMPHLIPAADLVQPKIQDQAGRILARGLR
jgi:hypothetical protein